ncbi:hypothetical protein WME97_26675 [Sorangium sp. So ce367]|uniref:hypothetical protein n=1 Tax=Sorangium sp. So ce367 TaxID=3133305 RepID=UPI003F5E9EFB
MRVASKGSATESGTAPEKSTLTEALAKLDAAMRRPTGSSVDPDRRRVAARLADLARCEDDELTAFARRHLPGRAADEAALRAAREMLLAIGRVLGPEGESAEALVVLKDAHGALDERLAEAKRAAAQRAEEEAAAKRAAEEAAATTGAPALVEAQGPLSRLGGGLPFVPPTAAKYDAEEVTATTSAPALVEAQGPLSRLGGGLPFVPAAAPMAAPPAPMPAPMAVLGSTAVPGPAPLGVPAAAPAPLGVPAPIAVPALAPMAVPVAAPASVAAPAPVAAPEPPPAPASTPAPQSVTQPAIVPVPAPASVPRTDPPASGAESKPLSKTLPDSPRVIDSALPFIPVASEERPRPSVARFDSALPFQPVASPDGQPAREPGPAPAHHSAAVPLHDERHSVAATPSAQAAATASPLPVAASSAQAAATASPLPVAASSVPPVATPSAPLVAAPSAPPVSAPSALLAATPSVPPASTPAPASVSDPLSARPPPSLTLNQYAGLVVACELYPAYVESTNARYGVPTPAARAALDAFWAGRFAADPALAQRWPELCEAARRYFLQSR